MFYIIFIIQLLLTCYIFLLKTESNSKPTFCDSFTSLDLILI